MAPQFSVVFVSSPPPLLESVQCLLRFLSLPQKLFDLQFQVVRFVQGCNVVEIFTTRQYSADSSHGIYWWRLAFWALSLKTWTNPTEAQQWKCRCVKYSISHFSVVMWYLKAHRVLTGLLMSSAKSVSKKKKWVYHCASMQKAIKRALKNLFLLIIHIHIGSLSKKDGMCSVYDTVTNFRNCEQAYK